MKILFLVVGKTNDASLIALQNKYQQRLKFYIPFEYQVLPELKNTKHKTENQQKELEADMLLKHLEATDFVILLDENGMQFTSVDFAQYLEHKIGSSLKRIVFVVGGPYGFAPSVYLRANDKIALSKMTFSHQMVRLLFVEQLYRAFTILKGEPYHHV